MSQINYANATFNKVVLEGTDFKDKEAVTASYVTSKIDDLVNGASTSFDTLKELSLALSNGEDVAVAVTSQISSLGLSLNLMRALLMNLQTISACLLFKVTYHLCYHLWIQL